MRVARGRRPLVGVSLWVEFCFCLLTTAGREGKNGKKTYIRRAMSLAQAESVRLHTKKNRAFFPSSKLQWYSSAWVSFFFAHFYLQRSGKEWKIELDGERGDRKKKLEPHVYLKWMKKKPTVLQLMKLCQRSESSHSSECEIVQCFSGCVTCSLSSCYVFAIAHNKSMKAEALSQMMRVIVCDIHS